MGDNPVAHSVQFGRAPGLGAHTRGLTSGHFGHAHDPLKSLTLDRVRWGPDSELRRTKKFRLHACS